MTSPAEIRVLVVDDDRDEFLIVSNLLSRADGNYRVEWVSDFESARDVLARPNTVDVALIDYYLGPRTGLDLISEIHRNRFSPPMILFTGLGDMTVDLAALEVGAADYLSKTHLTPESLGRAIRYAHQNARTRAELAAILDRADALLSALPYAVMRVDVDGVCLDWHVPEGLVSRAMSAGEHETVADLIPPEVHDRVLETLREAIETGKPGYLGFQEEGPRHWELRVVPIADTREAVIIIGDVTDQEKGRAAIEQRAALDRRFRGLVEAAGDAVIAIDADQHITLVNGQAEAMFGYRPGELIGRPLHQLIPARYHSIHSHQVDDFLTNVTAARTMASSLDLWGLRRDGDEFPIEVSIAHLEETDELAAVAIVRDVTERYAAERVLKQREVELRDLVRSKDQLIASISHEIRTPLTAITGFAQLLHQAGGDLTEAEKESYIRTLVEQGNELTNIVDDLLVAAKADLGSLAVVAVPVDLRAQLAQVLKAIDPEEIARIEITGGPVKCKGDPQRVRQVIRNLVTNALRHGGSTVEVQLRADSTGAHLLVIDDGVGVIAGQEERIFQPYQRAHETPGLTSTLGLGLHISRTLARLMGGDIVYRREGDRTIFQLTLRPPD